MAAALDKALARILVAVTDRRILSAGNQDFLKQGLFENEVDLADVRYVRSVPGNGQCESRVDLVTRDQNLDLYFAPEVDTQAVASLAGLFAESMTLPEGERDDLLRRSEEHTSELQSLMRISYAVFCLKKKKDTTNADVS